MSEVNVTVHRPTLTPEESRQRMDEIKRASAKIIIAHEKAKKEREKAQGE